MEFYGWILAEGFILMCWPGVCKGEEERRIESAELLSLNGGEFFPFWPGSGIWEGSPTLRKGYERDFQVLFN